jgi:exodeoxyribonuclease VII large subunit
MRLVEERAQRLDERGERLKLAGGGLVDRRRRVVAELGARLPDPKTQLERAKGALARLGGALAANANAQRATLSRETARVAELLVRAKDSASRGVETRAALLGRAADLLESYSHKKTLARGFALVTDSDGAVVSRAADARKAGDVTLRFADGEVAASVSGGSAKRAAKPAQAKQGSLL